MDLSAFVDRLDDSPVNEGIPTGWNTWPFVRRPLLFAGALLLAQIAILGSIARTFTEGVLALAGVAVIQILLATLFVSMRKRYLLMEDRVDERTEELERANAILRDEVDMRKSVESSLRFEATHDSLTGLHNRQAIQREIREWLRQDFELSLLFVDVDDFKIINDTLGHDAGDAMLKRIADRMLAVSKDAGLEVRAGRLGGDEFILVIRDCDTDAATSLAERMQEALAEPLETNGRKIAISLSIGICTAEQGAHDVETLLRRADLAMYRAKQTGKASCAIFDPAMQKEMSRRITIEDTLADADALSRGLSAVFQPILNLRDGQVQAVEAFARWSIDGLGDVSPGEFMPIAEQIRRTPEIDERIIQLACDAWRTWRHADLHLHINLSHRSLARRGVAGKIIAMIEERRVPLDHVVFEIGERSFFEEEGRAAVLENIRALRSSGIRFGLDDFGTGYSSLSVLHELPIDVLKIDHKYLTNLDGRRDYIAVIESMIRLAHNLDLAIVAEGVNSAENLAAMLDLECDFVQGFYFCKGSPAEEIPRIISRLESLTGRDAA